MHRLWPVLLCALHKKSEEQRIHQSLTDFHYSLTKEYAFSFLSDGALEARRQSELEASLGKD